ncbi:hypothetical protein T484DRAFT_1756120 [Baffinella frigidus]|nr:hypothetical protein T484DRAFT_1756120 [Cryptophyta sp. CCMP2293]
MEPCKNNNPTTPAMKRTKKPSKSRLLIRKKGFWKKDSDLAKVGGVEKSRFYPIDAVREQRTGVHTGMEYLVSWKGFDRDEDSWIDELPSFFARQWRIEKEWTDTALSAFVTPSNSSLDVLSHMACLELAMV